jgi:hypothetical protein
MFVARILVGKTKLGNSSMKTRPLEFDSTTDGNHIFVTYHDAEASGAAGPGGFRGGYPPPALENLISN